MGGEAGLTLIRWAPSQALPDGYEVVFDGNLYWWQHKDGDYGGGDVDRWIVRRLAIEDARKRGRD